MFPNTATLQREMNNNIRSVNACGTRPKEDHGLFPPLLLHEEIQHDSALAEQGQTSNPHNTIMMTKDSDGH